MKAVIPAAKKKESLFPFSDSKPTALMPVKGEPLISQTIDKLKIQGVTEVYVIVNYREEMFRELFEERNDVNIVLQEELSGTAEALKTVDFIEEDFIVVNSDVVISENDIGKLIDSHEGDLSMLATDDKKAEKFGVLSIQNDEIVSIEEKPEDPDNSLINSGIYILKPEIFDLLEDSDKSSLTRVINENIETLDCRFKLIEDYWIDIGSPKKLWKADQVLRENELEPDISEDAEISDKALVGENVKIQEDVKIEKGSVIKGETVVCQDTVVGPNTVIENSTVGPDSQLENCHIQDSLLFEENIIDSFVDLENAVFGEECDVKSGSVIKESFIGPRSYIDMNNSIRGVKFVPDARTDLSEISK
ncbi:MAG: sugar phosphate nucleotidyltransferase [Candidatus Nanohaloarchaea archaeon]